MKGQGRVGEGSQRRAGVGRGGQGSIAFWQSEMRNYQYCHNRMFTRFDNLSI